MSKLDELRRGAGGNANESMGGRDRREAATSAPYWARSVSSYILWMARRGWTIVRR